MVREAEFILIQTEGVSHTLYLTSYDRTRSGKRNPRPNNQDHGPETQRTSLAAVLSLGLT